MVVKTEAEEVKGEELTDEREYVLANTFYRPTSNRVTESRKSNRILAAVQSS